MGSPYTLKAESPLNPRSMVMVSATCPVTSRGSVSCPPISTQAWEAIPRRVRDVTITGFRIVGFDDGVFGFGTENLKVSRVVAIDNSDYGVASFDGIGTRLIRNATTGSHDAGIYVGDSVHANAVVTNNRSWDNSLGILVRHSHKVLCPTTRSGEIVLECFCCPTLKLGAADKSRCSTTG